jgi:hypothetical protein
MHGNIFLEVEYSPIDKKHDFIDKSYFILLHNIKLITETKEVYLNTLKPNKNQMSFYFNLVVFSLEKLFQFLKCIV